MKFKTLSHTPIKQTAREQIQAARAECQRLYGLVCEAGLDYNPFDSQEEEAEKAASPLRVQLRQAGERVKHLKAAERELRLTLRPGLRSRYRAFDGEGVEDTARFCGGLQDWTGGEL